MAIKRIHSKGEYRHEEMLASGIFSPGHLVKMDSNGKVLKHATEGGPAEAMFATEDALQGNTTATAYAVGDLATVILPVKGAVVNAMLKAGDSYVRGDLLISAGDGTLKEVGQAASAVSTTEVLAVVEAAAVDLSASAAVDTLGAVRII